MSTNERYDTRDRVFSHWHRRVLSRSCTAIDLDWVEYCERCRRPLALIELALDVGQQVKPMPVTAKLGRMARVPTYRLFYTVDVESDSVVRGRLRKIGPVPESMDRVYSADELARWFEALRDAPCVGCEGEPPAAICYVCQCIGVSERNIPYCENHIPQRLKDAS